MIERIWCELGSPRTPGLDVRRSPSASPRWTGSGRGARHREPARARRPLASTGNTRAGAARGATRCVIPAGRGVPACWSRTRGPRERSKLTARRLRPRAMHALTTHPSSGTFGSTCPWSRQVAGQTPARPLGAWPGSRSRAASERGATASVPEDAPEPPRSNQEETPWAAPSPALTIR